MIAAPQIAGPRGPAPPDDPAGGRHDGANSGCGSGLTPPAARVARIAGTGGSTRFAWSVGIPFMLLLAALPQRAVHIRPGDTLWGLSRQYHTSVAELKRLNHLPSDTIYAGRSLLVPAVGPAGSVGPGTGTYRVRAGDTASGIASRHHVSLSRLAARNGLHGRMVIRPGEVLRVPVTGRHGHQPLRRHYPPAVVAAARRHRAELARRPRQPTARMRRLIVATARRRGVEPALALAVAHQESGLRMNVVSAADAIGVMQVLPSTGRWLGRQVLGRPLDLLDPGDNVLAGVALLGELTRAAPLRQAIAGYYQGLASVRAHGMYPDTAHYVRNILALQKRFR
ncbi:MAG TPA: LysM peptidoglycan-binding domain-containing protein [Mycobacteriales bacterium]|nr:LysM peptidoglycan-binding domain-containing protein [Mycobacteriales bacterium]